MCVVFMLSELYSGSVGSGSQRLETCGWPSKSNAFFLSVFFFFLTEKKKVCGSLVYKLGNWSFIVTYSQTLKWFSKAGTVLVRLHIKLSGLWGSLESAPVWGLDFGQGVVLGRCLP